MEFFFNELSIHNQFRSADEFRASIHQIRMFRKNVTDAELRFYIHRGILQRPVLGVTLRKGIQKYFQRQQIKTLMNWFSKDGFFLPDDSFAEIQDRFECYFPETYEDEIKDISGSALAECAFRKFAGEETGSISLEKSKFTWSPIRIVISQTEGTLIDNDFNLKSLEKRLTGLLPPISSWSKLIDRIRNLPNVDIESYVDDKLKSNPFSQGVADSIYLRAKELSELATATTLKQFNEYFDKYATGRKARFSDSSPSEKTDYETALTFKIDGVQHLCPYHGKVKNQQYRLHILGRPSFQKSIRIVYIGPKLTKR